MESDNTMHTDFPKLYSEISSDGDRRSERWAGVEAFSVGSTKYRIEMLLRLAFDTKPPAEGHQQGELADELASFHKAFSDTDPSYEPGKRQSQILAAAVLVQLFSTTSQAATAAITTSCNGIRKAPLPIDLVTAADNMLSLHAATRRRRPELSELQIRVPELEYELNFDEAQPNQPATLEGVFDQFSGAVEEAFKEVTAKTNASIKALVNTSKQADEELDMLSWVFGERLLFPDQAFTETPADQMPLLFARDLASLTTIHPGPNSAPALLERAGIESKKPLSIVEAVNSVTDEWIAKALSGKTPSPATAPIHFALSKRQETGAGDSWYAGWAAITGIEIDAAMSPLLLAKLFYHEILWQS